MTVQKIKEWIKKEIKDIVDPSNDGWKEEDDEQCFDEGEQSQLRILHRLKDFIKHKK